MILQRDVCLREKIRKYGCYFMCILFWVNKYRNRGFDKRSINDVYEYVVSRGWMGKDCYIKSPIDIFRYLGFNVKDFRKESADYVCDPDEFEILEWERSYEKEGKTKVYSHFTCGNGQGCVTFDPYGFSNAVKYGYLKSKRVFEL